MRCLAYHRYRYQLPAAAAVAVFLMPGADGVPASAAVPASPAQLRPAWAQVAARGTRASWEFHCRLLVRSAPYAGTWTVQDIPDGSSPEAALALVLAREQAEEKTT